MAARGKKYSADINLHNMQPNERSHALVLNPISLIAHEAASAIKEVFCNLILVVLVKCVCVRVCVP